MFKHIFSFFLEGEGERARSAFAQALFVFYREYIQDHWSCHQTRCVTDKRGPPSLDTDLNVRNLVARKGGDRATPTVDRQFHEQKHHGPAFSLLRVNCQGQIMEVAPELVRFRLLYEKYVAIGFSFLSMTKPRLLRQSKALQPKAGSLQLRGTRKSTGCRCMISEKALGHVHGQRCA